jgi:hypothetical protein
MRLLKVYKNRLAGTVNNAMRKHTRFNFVRTNLVYFLGVHLMSVLKLYNAITLWMLVFILSKAAV